MDFLSLFFSNGAAEISVCHLFWPKPLAGLDYGAFQPFSSGPVLALSKRAGKPEVYILKHRSSTAITETRPPERSFHRNPGA